MCKKQTSASHSSTESEIISLDAGLRLDGITAFDLWDLIVAVLGNTNQSHKEQGDLSMNKREVRSPPHTIQKRKQSQRVINGLDNVDFSPSNVKSSNEEALLYVFEDNEAVIKMIIKGRSPTMRHVSRTHRVALDWLFDRINLDPKIQIKDVDTKYQLADILTRRNFTRDEWNNLLHLFNISHFSSISCSQNFSSTSCPETMAQRMQEEKRRREDCGKVKTDVEPGLACCDKFFDCAKSTCIEKSGDTQGTCQPDWKSTGRLVARQLKCGKKMQR